jgi:hypothetical protein
MRHTEMVEWWVQATADADRMWTARAGLRGERLSSSPLARRPAEFAVIAAVTTRWPDGIISHTTRVLFVFSPLVSLLGSPYACQDCA